MNKSTVKEAVQFVESKEMATNQTSGSGRVNAALSLKSKKREPIKGSDEKIKTSRRPPSA